MASKKKRVKTKFDWKEFKRQKVLMFWAAIFVIYGVIFYYLPLGGWVIAFQNYKPGFHKSSASRLHIQHDRVRACRQLFAHDGAGDQRHLVHRRRHIPQGIELFIRRVNVYKQHTKCDWNQQQRLKPVPRIL